MSKINSIEIWKDILGYKGSYQISNFGRIKSIQRIIITKIGRRRFVKERIIKQRNHNQGYLMVSLSKNGKLKNYLVHILVLSSFVVPCPKGMECCHKDGNKKNNNLENLRWGTRSSNNYDRIIHGWVLKLNLSQVEQIRKMYATGKFSQQYIGCIFGVNQRMVSNIILKKSWKW